MVQQDKKVLREASIRVNADWNADAYLVDLVERGGLICDDQAKIMQMWSNFQ